MRFLGIVEDIFLLLDVVFTVCAVISKNYSLDSVSNSCFVISGVCLVVAFFAMVAKRIFMKNSSDS